MEHLSKSKKPLVGHNSFRDICHIYNDFFADLPPTLEEWREAIHNIFPSLFDTKIMTSESGLYSRTTLECLMNSIAKSTKL